MRDCSKCTMLCHQLNLLNKFLPCESAEKSFLEGLVSEENHILVFKKFPDHRIQCHVRIQGVNKIIDSRYSFIIIYYISLSLFIERPQQIKAKYIDALTHIIKIIVLSIINIFEVGVVTNFNVVADHITVTKIVIFLNSLTLSG